MIERMGDKASAIATMKAAGVPTIPGSEGLIESFEKAKKNSQENRLPSYDKGYCWRWRKRNESSME